MVTRSRVVLAATMILIIGIDLLVLFTGVLSGPRERRALRNELDETLIEYGEIVTASHEDTNAHRGVALQGLTTINAFLPIARTPGGVEAAEERWPSVRASLAAGKESSTRLAPLTAKIINQAEFTLETIAKRREVTKDGEELSLLNALEVAMGSLIETHGKYAELNSVIVDGYATYDTLGKVIDTFFAQLDAGRFRNVQDAADVYSFRTEDFIGPINTLQERLNDLQEAADLSAARTAEAFILYEQLAAS